MKKSLILLMFLFVFICSCNENVPEPTFEELCPTTIYEITCINTTNREVYVQAVLLFCFTECCGREEVSTFSLAAESSETINDIYTYGPEEAYFNLILDGSIYTQVIVPTNTLKTEIIIEITFDGTEYNIGIS